MLGTVASPLSRAPPPAIAAARAPASEAHHKKQTDHHHNNQLLPTHALQRHNVDFPRLHIVRWCAASGLPQWQRALPRCCLALTYLLPVAPLARTGLFHPTLDNVLPVSQSGWRPRCRRCCLARSAVPKRPPCRHPAARSSPAPARCPARERARQPPTGWCRSTTAAPARASRAETCPPVRAGLGGGRGSSGDSQQQLRAAGPRCPAWVTACSHFVRHARCCSGRPPVLGSRRIAC